MTLDGALLHKRPRPTLFFVLATLVGPLVAGSISGQSIRNSGFEDRDEADPLVPAFWMIGGDGYEAVLDSAESQGGAWSLRMRRVEGGTFGVAAQSLSAEGLHGQLVRLSGAIKTEGVGGGYAGLWLRIDGPEGTLSLDNMVGRGAVGTSNWTRFQVEGIVEPRSERLVFGVLMPGGGTAWFDDLTLEMVPLGSLPAPAGAALDYLNRALDLMQERSLLRDSIDWVAHREVAIQRASGAQDANDTYAAIQAALMTLGDRHSRFMDPMAVEVLENRGSVAAVRGNGPNGELLEGRYGYVLVPAFSGIRDDVQRDFAEALQDLIALTDEALPCGWIVDLRQNTGGNMWPMLAGLGPLLGEGELGFFVNPGGGRTAWGYADGASRMNGNDLVQVSEPYELRSDQPPVAVLTGPRTASSGEAIVTAFRGRPETRSFGAGTAGLSTSNASIRLSDGAMILLTTSVFADRTGETYGGVIEPDEPINELPEGTPLTADRVVLRAMAWLAEQTQCQRGSR